MTVEEPADPPAHLLVAIGSGPTIVPIYDQLFVGRECAGIGERRRLVLDDPEVSRRHLEIRLDVANHRAFVIDDSTNGSLLNGIRLDRTVPTALRSGDEIRLGNVALAFYAAAAAAVVEAEAAVEDARPDD